MRLKMLRPFCQTNVIANGELVGAKRFNASEKEMADGTGLQPALHFGPRFQDSNWLNPILRPA